MSKLSFRARALDAIKPMPVYYMEEVPDLPDFAAINRAVPQMPTGMEKEEECEHHLQRAISAQQAYGHTGELVIPTPEVYEVPKEFLQKLYPTSYKHPRQLIHVQPFSMEQDIPDYDMDSEDEKWFSAQAAKMEITPLQFELMMDRLEKSSSQQVVTLKEAKLLLKEDDDLLIAVYDYWLLKRLRTARPLIPQVKSEKRDGSTNNNPYVAFRRRTEKMQTRKNRKNDETSYEKMLKLKRDLIRASSLLEMVRKREKIKREHLHLTVEIFEKRYLAGDFSGQLLAEMLKLPRPAPPPAQKPVVILKPDTKMPKHKPVKTSSQKKRTYKKKSKLDTPSSRSATHRTDLSYGDVDSSGDEAASATQSDQEDDDPDGPFAFRRKKNCNYYAPREQLGNWPWCSKEENGLADSKYRYCLTSIPTYNEQRCIGFARRRIGRGGRLILDRAYTPLDDCWDELDSIVTVNPPNGLPNSNEFLREIKEEWKWFRPKPSATSTTSRLPSDQKNSDSDSDDPRQRNSLNDNRLAMMTTKLPMDLNNRNSQCSSQEELFEMQRKQLERLKTSVPVDESASTSTTVHSVEHSFMSQPTSRFMLNPCRVQFPALSPVIADFAVDEATNSTASPTAAASSSSSAATAAATASSFPTSSSTCSSSVAQQHIALLSVPTSITSGMTDRATLTNGPVAERSDGAVGSSATIIRSSDKDFIISSSDALASIDFSQLLHSVNLCLPGTVPSTAERGGGLVASPSSDNSIHLIHAKTFASAVPAGGIRFMGIEQNGREIKLKPEAFLNKVKIEKVNDSGVSMDVT